MKTGKKRIYDILLVLCILVFVISGTMLVYKMIVQKKNDGRLEELSDMVLQQQETAPLGVADSGSAQEEEELSEEEITRLQRQARVEAYSRIKEQNSDLVGWIKIEGTKIDYPVLQSPDRPNFYLKHDFDQKSSAYGAPYVAEECDLAKGCANILIYGHHMKNGSMFAALDGYLDPEFREAHPIIQFDTLEEYGDYEVMAVFTMSAVDQENPLYDWITAGSEETFNQYVAYIKRNSVYDMGIDAQWGDELISMITCEYTHQDGRLIVVAKKIHC